MSGRPPPWWRRAIPAPLRRGLRGVARWMRGPLRVCVDDRRGGVITGWAADERDLSSPVTVCLLEGDRVLASVEARSYRSDLVAAGLGDGRHGFTLLVPNAPADGTVRSLRLVARGKSRFGIRQRVLEQFSWEGAPPRGRTIDGVLQRGLPPSLVRPQPTWDEQAPALGAHAAEGLRLPVSSAPLVSIVIPVHNKRDMTLHALRAVATHSGLPFEVIVVDDGSTDEVRRIEHDVEGLRVVRHERAQGFVASCNDGARVARGDYLVFLNNDTEVTPAWLEELLWPFFNQSSVGLVGAQLLFADGRLQESGGIVWASGTPWNVGRGGDPLAPEVSYTRDVDYVSGACLAIPTPLWVQLGGFDAMFSPAYYEDTDLAFRVRAAGFRTVCAPLSRVFHIEGASAGVSVESGMKRYQAINAPKFVERWHPVFAGHGSEGVRPDLEKDRKAAFRVLMIDAQVPTPDQDAGSYAAIQEIRLMQRLGAKVSFVDEAARHAGRYTADLQRRGVECLYAPFDASVPDVLRRRGDEFDAVYITRYYVAERFVEAVRTFAPRARLLLNNADLHFLREIRAATVSGDATAMRAALATRSAELDVMQRVDVVLSYSDVEKAVIQSHCADRVRVMTCPWVAEIRESVPDFDAREGIAFLGGFAHRPNVEGIHYFVREVMPLLRKVLPGVPLRIYGSRMPDEVRSLEGADIVPEGAVAEVSEAFDRCRVFVAPLLSGAGIKGKVISALAHGVPSVISPVAAEGTGVRDGLDVRIATTPREWCDAIVALYQDASIWRQVSQSAQALVARRYGIAEGLRTMREAFRAAGLSVGDEGSPDHDRRVH